MNKKTSGSALLSGKCPACHQGDVFKFPVTRISHFAEMNHQCPVCGASFEREPGFYYGAMFITYAFNAALVIVAGLAMFYLLSISEMTSLILIALLSVLLTPFSFRFSRLIWLYWFGGLTYDPNHKV
jgi:uncharacterized protein (DUF983 family)